MATSQETKTIYKAWDCMDQLMRGTEEVENHSDPLGSLPTKEADIEMMPEKTIRKMKLILKEEA